MAELSLEHLTKRYAGGAAALRGVDLMVPDGALTALVGPSGSGKTTVLRAIAGLETPTKGTIRLGDTVLDGLPPRRRDVAMVFQDLALYPHMTVRRNLAFACRFQGVPRDEVRRRVASVAQKLEIDALLDRRPAQLSGGEQQRVAVGRALVREARCLLYDEPLSNLDVTLRDRVREEIRAMHDRCGTTTLYVTHDQEEAMSLGDRVAVLHAGRIRQEGTPRDLYDRPEDRFVAGFFGTPPMNFVEGRIEEGVFVGADLRVSTGDGRRQDAVVLGVRPASISVERGARDGAVAVSIESIRFMGGRTDVVGRTPGGVRLCASPQAPPPAVGEQAWLSWDPDACHLFEPGDQGRRVGDGEARG